MSSTPDSFMQEQSNKCDVSNIIVAITTIYTCVPLYPAYNTWYCVITPLGSSGGCQESTAVMLLAPSLNSIVTFLTGPGTEVVHNNACFFNDVAYINNHATYCPHRSEILSGWTVVLFRV